METFERVYEDNLERFDVFVERLAVAAGDRDVLVATLELFMDRLCDTIDAMNKEVDRAF